MKESLKVMSRIILYLPLILLFAGGCAPSNVADSADQLPDVKIAPGEFALAVGGQTLTSKEVLDTVIEYNGGLVSVIERFRPIAQAADLDSFRRQARPQLEQILTTKISHMLVYEQAKRQFEGKGIDPHLDRVVEGQVRDFVLGRFDADRAAAEQYLEKSGMDWKSFREYQKKRILADWYLSTRLPEPAPVTYSELAQRYEQIKDEEFATPAAMAFELLDIELARLNPAELNKTPLENAKALASEMLARLQSGQALPDVARDYPAVSYAGFRNPVDPQSLAEPYNILPAKAAAVKPGQIAGPIDSADGNHIFIIKLISRTPKSYRPLSEVQGLLRRAIANERRAEALNKIQAEFAKQAKMALDDRFIDFCLQETYEMSRQ